MMKLNMGYIKILLKNRITFSRKITFLVIICINFSLCAENKSLDLISNVDMFDIGLAKINNDNNYDIYTVNHVFAESILISDNGTFSEHGSILGLSQTNNTLDYESTGRSPKIKNGLNIYSARRKQLVLVCQKCKDSISGTIKFPAPKFEKNSVTLIHKENSTFTKSHIVSKDNQYYTIIKFELDSNGLIVLNSIFIDINIEFDIDFPKSSIFLGEFSESPDSNKFFMASRDNHSFAWAKVDSDSTTDVFMATGGLRARIKEFSFKQVLNELLYFYDSTSNKFKDKYKDTGMKKGTCRTYRSEWVDFDNDGDLDLYLGCKNGRNIMYQQIGLGSGKFTNIAKSTKLDFIHADEFRWVDFNNDNAVDIITIQQNKLVMFKNVEDNNKKRYFEKVKNSSPLGKKLDSVNTSIKVIDLNNDGQLEVFVSTKDQIFYFEYSDKNGYIKRNLDVLNLPKKLTGNLNFVDVNLDGYLDLCLFNHGIYLQNSKNKFVKTDLFPDFFIDRKYQFKNILWFDIDINGNWDVINAESYGQPNKKMNRLLSYQYKDIKKWDKTQIYKNIVDQKTKNWLQIDLVGSNYNLDAIGAKIAVIQKDGIKQYRTNHGTNDSFHSQGHYRQYFGFENDSNVDVQVTWPNGTISILKSVHLNQLITINYKA